MASPDTLIDGDYSRPTPVGMPRLSYPFRQNNDRVSAVIQQDFWQTSSTYVPMELNTPMSQGSDFNFIDESPPVLGLAGIYQFTRTFARVPVAQSVGVSASVAKPQIPGTSRGFLMFTANAGALQNTNGSVFSAGGVEYSTTYFADFSTGITYGIYGTIATVSSAAQVKATGGTFTLTYKTSTTAALNWNDSNATIAAAVNGLASIVADGITVTASTGLSGAGNGSLGLTATAGTWLAAMSMNAASLTPVNATTVDVEWQVSAPTIMGFWLRCALTSTAHGITAGAAIVFYGGTNWEKIPSANWSVPDVNTILVPGNASGATTATKAAKYVKDYTPGTVICRATSTTNYYLPGVSAGINSFSDIPIPTFQGDGASILNAIFSNTGTINFIVGNLTLWMGDIYSMNKVVINASDIT